MPRRLEAIESDEAQRVRDATEMLVNLSKRGYDHVTVIGYSSDGRIFITSSATASFEEDIMRLELAKLQKWQDGGRE